MEAYFLTLQGSAPQQLEAFILFLRIMESLFSDTNFVTTYDDGVGDNTPTPLPN